MFSIAKGFTMYDDWEDAKTTAECAEMATVDCCDEYEQASGWLNALNDVFSEVKKFKVAGDAVIFKNFDLVRDAVVVAVCEKDKKQIKVTLDSIELIKPKKAQKLWLKAWLEWAK